MLKQNLAILKDPPPPKMSQLPELAPLIKIYKNENAPPVKSNSTLRILQPFVLCLLQFLYTCGIYFNNDTNTFI